MKLFRKLFGFQPKPSEPVYSDDDIQTIAGCAGRCVEVINESLKIAANSKNPDTKISRLDVAKQKLEEVKHYVDEYPFLSLSFLDAVESDILRMEQEFLMAGYQEIADGNTTGDVLEKEGRIEEAIVAYEALVERKTDTPFTYRRLAILYRKLKRPGDELRIITAALESVARGTKHFDWFESRLAKMK